jgi:pilus assembly protein CpaF
MKNMRIETQIREGVLSQLDMTRELEDEEINDVIERQIQIEAKEHYISIKERNFIRKKIFNSLRRLDVLQELLEDPEVTEIMVNGPEDIFVEKRGALLPYPFSFATKERLEDVVQQIVAGCNRVVNEMNPIADARLSDGSRVNIVMGPVALNGPIITIRKFPKDPFTMKKLIEIGSMTEEVSGVLKKLVESKYNIFISGGTGSGKTTFLNVLSSCIPKDERVITIEDSAELQLSGISNLVRMEARNANLEGKNQVSIRDLIKTALRMRPDRIILGEVRDGAAVDLISAFNTGHDGSISTGHGNSTKDMLGRLETLFLMGLELPLLAVRKQIASAVDIMIHLGRLRDKSRRVLEISEVLETETGPEISVLYEFRETGEIEGRVTGSLVRTENKLINRGKLERAGITVNEI